MGRDLSSSRTQPAQLGCPYDIHPRTNVNSRGMRIILIFEILRPLWPSRQYFIVCLSDMVTTEAIEVDSNDRDE